jgi:thiamine-phosphate pyrophosphorylase
MIRCAVTDRRLGDPVLQASHAGRLGLDYIQVREKDLEARDLYDLVCRVRDAVAVSRAEVLVNGRLDVALAAGVDGVHLPADGLPAERVRSLVRRLGCSVHSVAEAEAAERAQADYVIFGSVFASPGKQAAGLDALRAVTAAVRIPVLAIGGITPENTRQVLDAGAAGIAAIRMFQV